MGILEYRVQRPTDILNLLLTIQPYFQLVTSIEGNQSPGKRWVLGTSDPFSCYGIGVNLGKLHVNLDCLICIGEMVYIYIYIYI